MQQYEISYIAMHAPPLAHIMESEVVSLPHVAAAYKYGHDHAVSMNETKKYESIEIVRFSVRTKKNGLWTIVGEWHVRPEHEIKGIGLEEIRKQADDALNEMRLKPDDQ